MKMYNNVRLWENNVPNNLFNKYEAYYNFELRSQKRQIVWKDEHFFIFRFILWVGMALTTPLK